MVLKKISILFVALLLLALPLLYMHLAAAAPLSSRNVIIADSKPSATTTHQFNFTIPTISPIGSFEFEYCENTPFVGTTCTPPAGLDVSSAVLTAQNGETGFTKHANSTSNRLVIGRIAVAPSAIPVSYTFSDAVNPNTISKTVFVRIASFASDDGTGARTDEGAVAFSTASGVTIQGYVPPYLTFCVGVTVAVDCSSANGSQLNFGVLSSQQVRYLSSEFSGATNDVAGFSTSITGVTMTSGNNIIPALLAAQPSQAGVSQFGMNLRGNSLPIVGQDPQGVGLSSSVALAPYNTPNLFAFTNQVITNSPLPTDFTKFTASYIVNVSSSQKPGIYNTTLTYIATAAF